MESPANLILNRSRQLALVLLLATAALLTACRPAIPPGKPLSELTAQENAGHEVYAAKCARCHYSDSSSGHKGPGLLGLYRQPYLPSGAPPTDDRVHAVIVRGRNMMPATDINDQQLADLMAYLHTL